MKQRIKTLLKRIPFIKWGGVKYIKLRDKWHPVRGNNNIVSTHGDLRGLKKTIFGDDNTVEIKDSILVDCTVRIRGNGNHLLIEDGCTIIGCSFWLEGNYNTIVIGKNTTMTERCHFNAQEHNTRIIVGEDCMFSNTIIVRTSDSHPIYNSDGERINPACDVVIGNHVWVAPSSVIMKGAQIGDGCIIGSHSMVNKEVPEKSLAVGMPAKVVKTGIIWTRENILN